MLKLNPLGGGISSHNIFDEIISIENLFLAWDEFKRGKINKMDVQKFEYNLENNIFQLHGELKNKIYQHFNYTSFYIKDPKLRHIHKAIVKDRVLHHAIFRILYPIFDSTFIFDSYSCRINKGTHRAVRRLKKFSGKVSKNNARDCFVLKCDIRKFFSSIDHNVLISLISKRIRDENTILLIKEIIQSFLILTSKGLPLGNITSQLFANIYLNELDQYIKHNLKAKHYIRYADDFVLFSGNKDSLENQIPLIQGFLQKKLKLELHPKKVEIIKFSQGIDFLGYVSFPCHRILRTKTKKRILRKVKENKIKMNQNLISIDYFERSLQSYYGILKHCNSYKIKQELDKLI